MFRRRFSRGFGVRKRRIRFNRFRRRPKFARQKFDRITLYNNLNAGPNGFGSLTGNALGACGPVTAVACSSQDNPPFCGAGTDCGMPPNSETSLTCGCCVTEVQFNLFNSDTVQDFYQDSVTVVRMYGDIFYRALVTFPFGTERCTIGGNAINQYDELYKEAYAEQWHWSMRKKLRTQAQDVGGEQTPLDAASPIYTYDWTESSPPWLWQRMKYWTPKAVRTSMQMSGDSFYALCSNTAQAGYTVPAEASGSQPTYNVPAESTTCQSISAAGEACPQLFNGLNVTEPPWHRLRFAFRKHVRIVRDEDLNLTCHVRHPQLSILGGWNCIDPATFPAFSRAFDVNYQFYVRIAAVVRLN